MRLTKGRLSLIIILGILFLDQLLKIWVKTSFYLGERVHIADWFQLYFIENNGNRITEEIADTKNNNAKASDYKNRIVFIKNSDGQYFFAGVFKLVQYEALYRVHQIVSDRYPY